jgi:upstream activation factor subunit UAF30
VRRRLACARLPMRIETERATGGAAVPGKKLEKTATSKAAGGRANALHKPLQPSPALAAVVGPDSLPRTAVVSKVWDYIRAHNLQNPDNRREILADDRLRPVFGKDKVTMFELSQLLARHLT